MEWGPKLWGILHSVVAGTTKEKIREANWILHNLESVVPCQECRKHLAEYRKLFPIGEDIARWSWGFHQAVNKRLGKEGIPFEEIKYVNVKASWGEYKEIMKSYMLLNRVKGMYVREFGRHLMLWDTL
jgi:hypothetical protein